MRAQRSSSSEILKSKRSARLRARQQRESMPAGAKAFSVVAALQFGRSFCVRLAPVRREQQTEQETKKSKLPERAKPGAFSGPTVRNQSRWLYNTSLQRTVTRVLARPKRRAARSCQPLNAGR